jgi:hypothetical protein
MNINTPFSSRLFLARSLAHTAARQHAAARDGKPRNAAAARRELRQLAARLRSVKSASAWAD